jgi:uncharacterized protein
MLKVKTKIGPSGIHGTGLFADQFIPKGTVTWQYTPGWDVSHTEEEIRELAQFEQDYFFYYSYFDYKRGVYILPVDHLKFINHTEKKEMININSTPDEDVASRDIEPGEELLCDYTKFDPNYFERMGLTELK